MKSKHKSKTKTHAKSKTHSKTRTKTRVRPRHQTSSPTGLETSPSPTININTALKTCQEVEVGDIGGFGSPDELEEHEKRCSETGTQFCSNCGKTLCQNHYDLIHRDHDRPAGHPLGSSLA